ncbi:MAG: iron complex outermembrane receptor protein, partial [Parasphingorhabdus sp.]
AGFYMDYKDLQQVVTGLSGSFLPTVVNAGQAEIKGIELEVTALPTENLRLGFNAAWIDATFTELASADNIYPELGQEDPTQPGLLVRDLSGKKIPRVPETKLVMSAEYAKPLANGNTLGFGANYTWRSEVYWTIFNNEGVDQASYGLLNMQGYLESQDGAWRFSAFARNVLDERYFVQGGQTPKGVIPVPAATGKLGTPRTYGVSVSYLF